MMGSHTESSVQFWVRQLLPVGGQSSAGLQPVHLLIDVSQVSGDVQSLLARHCTQSPLPSQTLPPEVAQCVVAASGERLHMPLSQVATSQSAPGAGQSAGDAQPAGCPPAP